MCSAAPMHRGCQPGHAAAWEDQAVNALQQLYWDTRYAGGAWVRPRHDGSMAFQQAASDRIIAGLTSGIGLAVVADLNRLFRESVPAPGADGGGA